MATAPTSHLVLSKMEPFRMSNTQNWASFAVKLIATLFVAWFLYKLVRHRLYFRKLARQGLPMPPHNFILGHIPILAKAVRRLPPGAHHMYLPTQIRQMFPELGPDYYLDTWPVTPSILVVGSPEIGHQIAYDQILTKGILLKKYLLPLTSGLDLVSLDGHVWKTWRAIFNPGFSASQIMSLVPVVVKETQIYCEVLDDHAVKKDVFTMKALTDNLILDVIGQVTIGVRFDCQRSFSKFIHSLRSQIRLLSTGSDVNILNRLRPLRPLMRWYHGRNVDRYLLKQLRQRFDRRQQTHDDPKRSRTVIDLAMKAYAESQEEDSGKRLTTIDPHFEKMCLAQMKILLFAGHDTTSSAICFHLWLLSQNPAVWKQLREEHDQVFGSDPNQGARVITESPHLLNQIPLTVAVIKESLRLFPTVTSAREGEKAVKAIDSQGRVFPTEGHFVWPNQHTSHHDPTYWPQPDSFIPERWLVGPEHPLYPPKGVWRPFEQGPRSCIAQELAMIEMKIVLVLVGRSYVFTPAYDEHGATAGQSKLSVFGQAIYQTDLAGPNDDLPMRVEKIKAC